MMSKYVLKAFHNKKKYRHFPFSRAKSIFQEILEMFSGSPNVLFGSSYPSLSLNFLEFLET